MGKYVILDRFIILHFVVLINFKARKIVYYQDKKGTILSGVTDMLLSAGVSNGYEIIVTDNLYYAMKLCPNVKNHVWDVY